jgi:hypothetical protein
MVANNMIAAAGFTEAEDSAFGRVLGKSFSTSDINILGQLWDGAARAGDNAILSTGNSRYLFDLQRNRFWSRVASNPQARPLFEDAGCEFSGGAPNYMLNGRQITITIDHLIERQSAPNLALTSSNLRLSFARKLGCPPPLNSRSAELEKQARSVPLTPP